MEKLGKQLSGHDWESLIEDFQTGNQQKWLAQYPGLTILELALYTVVKRDFPLKGQLITFLEENAHILISDSNAEEGLGSVMDALKTVVQAPADGVILTYSLKEQMMVAATSIMIVADSLHRAMHHFEALVELLLGVINRPNHGPDRQSRAIACECLRQLEKAYPCLLHGYAGHFFVLCQHERTHALQNYVLLLTTAIHSLACFMYKASSGSRAPGSFASILSTSVALAPFNTPPFLVTSSSGQEVESIPEKELLPAHLKEFRKVVAFLLDRPQILTPFGTLEFVSHITDIAEALELQVSLLKVQFFGLIYSYHPVLCHLVLMIYARFCGSFEGGGERLCRRLTLISKEVSQSLLIRLLAIHWIMGLECLSLQKARKSFVFPISSSLYPSVFDPLALKAVKLDALAYCTMNFDASLQSVCHHLLSGLKREDADTSKVSVEKIFNDGLISVSAFTWLPPWRAETRLAFRMLHRFMTVALPHSLKDTAHTRAFTESQLFNMLQNLLVSISLDHQKLIPSVLAFIDRIMHCDSHRSLGECLLQIMNGHVILKLVPDQQLPSYFPIFQRIAQNSFIPPKALLELLTLYVGVLIKNFDPEMRFKSWSQASKVLRICRTVLMHHHSSRIFVSMSRLLSFLSRFFPDLEIRDSARMYLRMLISIPGSKLRDILNFGQQIPSDSSAPQLSSLFKTASPRPPPSVKHESKLLTRICLSRVTPLTVKQSWSLAMLNLDKNGKHEHFPADVSEEVSAITVGVEEHIQGEPLSADGVVKSNGNLLVVDSKVAGILNILRRHFSALPDFQHGRGLKIKVHCKLYFQSNNVSVPGKNHSLTLSSSDTEDSLSALYAIVINFSGPAQYRRIPSVRIPFLMDRPPENYKNDLTSNSHEQNSMLVPVKDGSAIIEAGEKGQRKQIVDNLERNIHASVTNEAKAVHQESVTIEIEPREPIPALIHVHIEASRDDGEAIHGQLQSIPVGIEDLFLKPPLPDDVPEHEAADYYSLLFEALWEACENPGNIGRETFLLRGGKKAVAIHGTGSVKLLEAQSEHVINAVKHFLASFVVAVSGYDLIHIVNEGKYIKNVVCKDEVINASNEKRDSTQHDPLRLKYLDDDAEALDSYETASKSIGSFSILILLPPFYHLLLKMEITELSTLVRIKTDHWPCLAYIDEYLEVLAIR